jgi:hypothetical protein
MTAVTTLRDPGSAEVLREALAERDIPVEVRRTTNFQLYFGAPGEEFELRVPAEHLDDARKLIEALSEELQKSVLAEAGVAPGENDAAYADDELPPPERRPRKPAWAVGISLISPIPGCGLLYARAFRLGYLVMGLTGACVVGAAVLSDPEPLLGVVLLLKPLDAILAPIFAARFNRKLAKQSTRAPR